MNIFITGINGFIGKHLAKMLIANKHYVIGLDIQEECAVSSVSEYFKGSVLDDTIIKKVMKNVDVVVHLAALTAHKDIVNNKFEALEINFRGTKNILDAFVNSPRARRFIYSSTGKVYGDIKSLPITETHPALPLNILGKSKYITERLIDFYNSGEKKIVIFRIFNVYGPEQKENFLVPTILSQISNVPNNSETEIVLGDIVSERDYVYIDDVVRAFVLGAESKLKYCFSIFNVATGKGTNAKTIVDQIAKIKKSKIKIQVNKKLLRADEKDVEFASFEKAKKILGWEPIYNLKEGLEKIIGGGQ